MNTAIRLINVGVAFHGHPVVRHVDLTLPDTGVTVLVGRSGSGKTTLLRTLNRLNETFPHCVTTGQVEVDLGHGLEPLYPRPNAVPRPVTELRRRIGMVFQTPNVLPVSVYRNMSMPLELVAGCPATEVHPRVRCALEAVGLWDDVRLRLQAPAAGLSGGQQQRLCLARTLALEPAVLLLDEPTASLDVHATHEVETLLSTLSQRYPVVMVSHSLTQARRLAERLLVFEEGALKHAFSSPDALSEKDLAALMEKF